MLVEEQPIQLLTLQAMHDPAERLNEGLQLEHTSDTVQLTQFAIVQDRQVLSRRVSEPLHEMHVSVELH